MSKDRQKGLDIMCKLRLSLSLIVLVAIVLLGPFFSYAQNWVSVEDRGLEYPIYLAGTRLDAASHLMEPLPVRGECLEVEFGGVILVESGVVLFLRTRVVDDRGKRLYFKCEFPNPLDSSNPFIDEKDYVPELDSYVFSSTRVISGLKGSEDYTAKVYVYESRYAKEPIEVIEQDIRVYADSQGDELLVFKDMITNLE
ncbi:hypothetical protein ACFL96_08210 [Thermoproteota archaeon]